jgi:hypothetical protein
LVEKVIENFGKKYFKIFLKFNFIRNFIQPIGGMNFPTRQTDNLKKVQEIYCEDIVKKTSSISEKPIIGKVIRTYLEDEEDEEEEYEDTEELEEGEGY